MTALCDIKQAYTQFGGNKLSWTVVLSNVHRIILLCNLRRPSLWAVLPSSSVTQGKLSEVNGLLLCHFLVIEQLMTEISAPLNRMV